MPLYQCYCETCDQIEDRICSWEEARRQVHTCGEPMQKLLGTVRLIGPTPTKPAEYGGKLMEKQSDVVRWENENPGLKTYSKTDRVIKDKLIDLRHQRDLQAKGLGFRDERHRQAEVKKEGGLPP